MCQDWIMCWEYNGKQKQMGSLHHRTNNLVGKMYNFILYKCINYYSPDIAATLMQKSRTKSP